MKNELNIHRVHRPLLKRARRPKDMPDDPLVRQLSKRKVEDAIREFSSLLDKPSDETEIQSFLENHSYFFNGIIRLFGASPLLAKISLGSDYEVDFACFDSGSCGPEWLLIEIESPKYSLFTKSGHLTAKATHAIQQVRDWQTWVDEHLEYARKTFPHIIYPCGYVFIGRRSELTLALRTKLRKINIDTKRYLEVHSFDWFISAAHGVLNLVERGHANWELPMRALKQSDIKDGLPSYSRRWIEQFMKVGHILYPEEFLHDRQGDMLRPVSEDDLC
jgi:hypothetical protein